MLRSRREKSLVSCGFQSAKITRQGIYTFPLKNGVLHRNKEQKQHPHKDGRGDHNCMAAAPVSFFAYSSICVSAMPPLPMVTKR